MRSSSKKTSGLSETFKPEYLRQKKAALLGADLNNITVNDEEIMNINNRNVTLNVSKSNNNKPISSELISFIAKKYGINTVGLLAYLNSMAAEEPIVKTKVVNDTGISLREFTRGMNNLSELGLSHIENGKQDSSGRILGKHWALDLSDENVDRAIKSAENSETREWIQKGFKLNLPAILYFISFDSKGETFYKVGVTQRTVDERYAGENIANLSTIKTIKYKVGAFALRQEKMIISSLDKYRYKGKKTPLRAGNSELFTSDISKNLVFGCGL